MIIGIGMDLVEVARLDKISRQYEGRFLERVFTADERAYCSRKSSPAIHLAGRFAAKEACVKALGCGIGKNAGWQDLEITRDETGKPTIRLSGAAADTAQRLGVKNIFLSITHTENHAAAVVVVEN